MGLEKLIQVVACLVALHFQLSSQGGRIKG